MLDGTLKKKLAGFCSKNEPNPAKFCVFRGSVLSQRCLKVANKNDRNTSKNWTNNVQFLDVLGKFLASGMPQKNAGKKEVLNFSLQNGTHSEWFFC